MPGVLLFSLLEHLPLSAHVAWYPRSTPQTIVWKSRESSFAYLSQLSRDFGLFAGL